MSLIMTLDAIAHNGSLNAQTSRTLAPVKNLYAGNIGWDLWRKIMTSGISHRKIKSKVNAGSNMGFGK